MNRNFRRQEMLQKTVMTGYGESKEWKQRMSQYLDRQNGQEGERRMLFIEIIFKKPEKVMKLTFKFQVPYGEAYTRGNVQ